MSAGTRAELLMARRATTSISRTALWFALGLAVMTALMVAFFPSIRSSSAELEDAYSNLPDGLMEAFGVGAEFDLGRYSSFMNAEMLGLVFPIAAGVFAIMQGAATVAREIESGSISLWLSIPTERWQLLLGKIVAVLAGSVLIAGATAAVVGIGSVIVDGDVTLAATLSVFAVLLGYMVATGGIAVACSALANERGRAAAIAAAIVLVCYVAKLIAGFSDTFDWLRYLSLFSAYNSLSALQDGAIPPATAVLYGVGIAGAIFGLISFQRRDIVI